MQILTMSGHPIDWMHPPSVKTRVSTDLIAGDGVRFTGSFRTCVHMKWMIEECQKKFGVPLHVIQPPYHQGVDISAGTHDYDACSDVWIPGVDGWSAQRWLRTHGFGCWFRHTGDWANPDDWHLHGFTLPLGRRFGTKVGEWIPGQLDDYYNHAFGLVDMHTPGSDDSWYPANIDSTIFSVQHYVNRQQQKTEELTMEYKDWSKQSKQESAADVVDELLGRKVTVRTPDGAGSEQLTVRQAIGRAANSVAITRLARDKIVETIEKDDDANK